MMTQIVTASDFMDQRQTGWTWSISYVIRFKCLCFTIRNESFHMTKPYIRSFYKCIESI